MDRLPPFDALIAFEAAARLGGMTRAATELGLTQSAVSHRVRRLERFMEVALFHRGNAGLATTAAGAALLEDVRDLLARASDLRGRCHAAEAPQRIRVGVGAALADNWLVRRLPDFSARHPAGMVELAVVENEAPERMAGLDLRILWVGASEARASTTQRPLFREHVFPVCAPGLLREVGPCGDPGLLARLPLLHKRAPGGQGAEWHWQTWFDRLGLPGRPAEALRFTAIGPAIAAALGGAGVALARSMLVRDALRDGRLVRLLPPERDMLSGKVHVVRWPGRHADNPRILAFAAWLAAAAQEAEDQPGSAEHAMPVRSGGASRMSVR